MVVKLIGNNDLGGTASTGYNVLLLQRFAAIGGMMSVFRILLDSTLTKFIPAVYSDNSGNPGSVLWSGIDSNAVIGWNDVILGTPIGLSNGIYYWLAVAIGVNACNKFSVTQIGQLLKYKTITYSGFIHTENPTGLTTKTTWGVSMAGWGSTGCPRQAVHMRRLM